MKNQIALVLAGTAAAVAGGFRLVQELVERSDPHESGADTYPEEQGRPTAPPAPSSTAPAPSSSSPGTPPEAASTGSTASSPTDPTPTKAPDGASKPDLYEIATTLKISGRSKMSKAELRDAIKAAS